MFKKLLNLTAFLFASVVLMSCGKSDELQLFNGETLEGWEGSQTVFRVKEGAIVGGNLQEPLEKSYYLCTKQEYENFELKLSARFIGSDLNINGGISFRADRVPNSNEVMGYQADIGYIAANAVPVFSGFTPEDTSGLYPLWGCLVDENRADTSRYPRPDIEIKINGLTTAMFTEKGNVPLSGRIALQAHSGGPYEIWYKNIRLKQIE